MKTQMILMVLLTILNLKLLKAQEPCLTNAWSAFNTKNYKVAIAHSDQCIDDFGRKALNIQQKIDSLKITPEIGPVNDNQKNRIFQNNLLNDVATACFIKGRSAECLYEQNKRKNSSYKQMAIDAYNLACKYGKGRCWDTKGWFWSPCEASKERLPLE